MGRGEGGGGRGEREERKEREESGSCKGTTVGGGGVLVLAKVLDGNMFGRGKGRENTGEGESNTVGRQGNGGAGVGGKGTEAVRKGQRVSKKEGNERAIE